MESSMDVRVGVCELRRGRHMIGEKAWRSEGDLRFRGLNKRGRARARGKDQYGGGDIAIAIEGHEGENGRCGQAPDFVRTMPEELDCCRGVKSRGCLHFFVEGQQL